MVPKVVVVCCFVILRPRETSKVMSGRSVSLTTLFLGRLRPPLGAVNQYFVHILSPVTDNCPS